MEAYQLTKNPKYSRIATETLDYIIREMTDETGAFQAAQDADSEGIEGKFYIWSRSEIIEILGEQKGNFFCNYYGATDTGNFENENILFRPKAPEDFAKKENIPVDTIENRLSGMKSKLLAVRAKRIPPGKDYKVITSWNGLMISSFTKGYQVLNDSRYLEAAEKAGNFIINNMIDDGILLHTYSKGKSKLPGSLDDYANTANAFVDLYESSFDSKWLTESQKLAEKMIELFLDTEDAGFFSTPSDRKHLLTRTKPFFDSSIPSGNSVAVLVLIRLSKLTDNSEYYDIAERTLQTVIPNASRQPRATSHMLRSLDFYISPTIEIAVAGNTGKEDLNEMLSIINSEFIPNKIIAFIDRDSNTTADIENQIPLLKNRAMLNDKATVYICENYSCKKPINQPSELAKLLRFQSE